MCCEMVLRLLKTSASEAQAFYFWFFITCIFWANSWSGIFCWWAMSAGGRIFSWYWLWGFTAMPPGLDCIYVVGYRGGNILTYWGCIGAWPWPIMYYLRYYLLFDMWPRCLIRCISCCCIYCWSMVVCIWVMHSSISMSSWYCVVNLRTSIWMSCWDCINFTKFKSRCSSELKLASARFADFCWFADDLPSVFFSRPCKLHLCIYSVSVICACLRLSMSCSYSICLYMYDCCIFWMVLKIW